MKKKEIMILSDNSMQSMYDTSFECTYSLEKSDDVYRNELLRAFKLEEPDFDCILKGLEELAPKLSIALAPVYKKMREEQTVLSHLLLSISGRPNTELDLLASLCAIDTFRCLHTVICDEVESRDSSHSVTELLRKLDVSS